MLQSNSGVYGQNVVQGTTTNKQISLFLLWMDELMKQQSNFKIADDKNSLILFESTTRLARTGSAGGTETGVLQQVKYNGNTFVILAFVFVL